MGFANDSLAKHPFEPIDTIPINMVSYWWPWHQQVEPQRLKHLTRHPLYYNISTRGIVLKFISMFLT
jgi:hypothetical protein